MIKPIKIIQSPFNPPMEVVEDIVIQLHAPYSDKSVTIQINPNIQDYQENADSENIKVRQIIFTTSTDQTKILSFDLKNNRKHSINIEGCDYAIELTNIGKEYIQGQAFLFYEFNVSKG